MTDPNQECSSHYDIVEKISEECLKSMQSHTISTKIMLLACVNLTEIILHSLSIRTEKETVLDAVNDMAEALKYSVEKFYK